MLELQVIVGLEFVYIIGQSWLQLVAVLVLKFTVIRGVVTIGLNLRFKFVGVGGYNWLALVVRID